jgi:hypothetical protein
MSETRQFGPDEAGELRKTNESEPQPAAQRQLWDYYIGELERPHGPKAAWEALASVFLNVAIRALGKKAAIANLRAMADWLESNDTKRALN